MLKNYFTKVILFLMLGLMSPQFVHAFCQMGCKQFTQVSMGLDCTAEITPDILLSSGNSCNGPFLVQVMFENMQPVPGSPFLGPEHVGMTLMASIIDTDSGNQCMVTIFIEDKFTPDLICGSTEVSCDAFTGFSIPNQFISTNDVSVTNNCQDILIPVAGIATLADVNLSLDFSLSNSADSEISLTSPLATTIDLFDGNNMAGCMTSDFQVLFDDQALLENTDFDAACSGVGQEVAGYFQPEMPLETFLADASFNGNWILTICAGAGATLNLNAYDLQLSTEEIIIPFPVPAGTQVAEQGDDYVLTGFDSCGPAVLSYTDDEVDESCASPYQQTISRNWLLTDGSGNTDECIQTILIERRAPSEIAFPPNYFPGQGEGPLACEDKEVDPGNAIVPNIGWNALPNGHPSPYDEFYPAPNDDIVKWYGTGTPILGACEDLSIIYEDTRINVCATGESEGCFTIKRQWMIFEHCTGVMFMSDQLIKVMDIEAPEISGLLDITVDIDQNVCMASTPAPIPILSDNCSDAADLSYTFSSNQGTSTYIDALDQYFVENLPPGISIFTYTASDCCGNDTTVMINVTVIDNVPPSVVCKDAQVSLTNDGTGKIFPESIDDGSNDNCSDTVYLKIIRVDDLLSTTNGSNTNQMITNCDSLNGDDNLGLFGNQIYFDDFAKFCCEDIPGVMVIVRVFDVDPGVGPVNPSDMNPGGFLFGHFNDCMRLVTVNDNLPPQIFCPADITIACDQMPDTTLTGMATAIDNCEMASITSSDQEMLNQCGEGTIIRTWKATTISGQMATCTQTITLVDTTAAMITYPADITVDCALVGDLTITGEPTVMDDCDLIGFNVQDDLPIPLMGDTCGYRIVRRFSGWSLCDNTETYMGTQTIISIDTTGPVINGMVMDLNVVCATDVPDPAMVTATDNCSSFNPANLAFSENTIPGSCPNDFTLIRSWTATDSCGNETSIMQTITVFDDVPPTLSVTPGDFTIDCGEEVPAPPNVTAMDNCGTIDPADINFTDTPGVMSCDDGLVRTRVWSVMDACGNPASVTRRYFQIDNENPMFINPPGDLDLACTDPIPPADIMATDDCTATIDLTVVLVETVSDSTCIYDFTLTRMWTVTDGCGKTAMHTQVITINDNEAPVFVNPPASFELACTDPIPTAPDLMATDDCTPDDDLVITFMETVSDSTCIYDQTITRKWTVTDVCGKMTMHTQVITINDNEAPVFVDPPASFELACTDPIPAAPVLTATDDCTPDADLVITFMETISDSTCIYDQTITRKWTVTDVCGKMTMHTQVITINDNEAPVFVDPPASFELACTDPIPTAPELMATDDCTPDDDLVITFMETVSDSMCIYDQTITRKWTVTDVCGKMTMHTQVITINDNEAPAFVDPPASFELDCTDPIPTAPVLTATDDCTPDDDLVITFMETVTDSTCIHDQTINRTWTVTDVCGKMTIHTQVITISDNEIPMFFDPPMDTIINCNDPIPEPKITAMDDCTNALLLDVQFMEVVTDSTCVYTKNIVRTWVATDICGKSNTHIQVISISDTDPPVFTFVPDDISVSCDETFILEDPTAMDNCELVSLITTVEGSTNGCDSITVRTFTATDRCGLTATAMQTVIIYDDEPPTLLNFPDDLTVSCDNIPIPASAFVDDNCDPLSELSASFRQDTIFTNCVDNYTLVRNYFTSDACGNRDTFIYNVTVMDMEDPVFVDFPDDIALDCFVDTTPTPGTQFEGPGAMDDCDMDVMITFSDSMLMGTCQMITRTWTATDNCGNMVSQDQIITFTDDEAPMFNMDPADESIDCQDVSPIPVVTATDNCELMGGVVFTQDTMPGFCPNAYTIVRVWKAIDLCGNQDSVTQMILVVDNEDPVIEFETLADSLITIDCGADLPDLPVININDNCSPVDSVTFTLGVKSITEENDQDNGIDITCPTIEIVQRTWVFFDQCGNSENIFQQIVIRDTIPPVLMLDTLVFDGLPCETDITPVEGGPYEPPTVTEACTDFMLDFGDVTTIGTCLNERTVTRTWMASDSCGNSSEIVQTFNFSDETDPIIICPDDFNIGIGGSFFEPHKCDTVLNFMPGTLMDNCDSSITVTNSINADIGGISTFNFPIGITPVTFTAEDNCGNTATCVFNVDVDDVRPPTAVFNIPDCFVLNPDNTLTVVIDSFATFIDCSFDTAFFLEPELSAVLELDGTDAGQPLNILIAFQDTSGNSSVFGNNPLDPIEVYFAEEANLCSQSPPPTAAGRIVTPLQEEMHDVPVYVDEMNGMSMTDENGLFQIYDSLVGPGYTFVPDYNDRIHEGLSALDLVLISRHIIGLQPITDPHLLIAADTDYSGNIGGFDLITLQRVILHITDEFPNGDAWRFVKEDYLFPLSGDPFSSPFPEMIMIDEMMTDYFHLNFTAIKVGDVNSSFSPMVSESKDRSTLPKALITMDDQRYLPGEQIRVPVYLNEVFASQGLDLEIDLSLSEASNFEITEGQIDPVWTQKGDRMLIQWVSGVGQELSNEQPLFYLNFQTRKSGSLKMDFKLSNTYLSNTGYANETASHAIELNIDEPEDAQINTANNHPILYPNVPNPFRQETTIRFYVPATGVATLQITNLDGRVIYESVDDYQKGYQEKVLRANQLPGGGVLQCQLITKQGTVSQKMLLIKD